MSQAERLNTALVDFTACIGSALEDVCSYGLTIGEAYVPFNPDPEDDCEDGEAACTQAWVRVMGVGIVNKEPSFEGEEGCATALGVSLEVGILRCFGIEEEGEAPSASDVLAASMQAMDDMNAIYEAAMACEVWSAIDSGTWNPEGPLGGQYGGIWTFDVEL